jgi:RNAse (barnase) inhibitor barstar
MLFAETLMQITWECVHFISTGEESTICKELDASGLVVFEIQGKAIQKEEDLLYFLAKELKFPAYFGMNWDALDECLRDLSWLPAKGYVLFLRDARRFWREASCVAGKFVEAWLFAAEEWSHDGVPFHLVFIW